MNAKDKKYDDLTVINGIGAVRQKWLRESFGVHTYQDLAAFSAEEIESGLKSDKRGPVPDRTEIETWLVQAQELATEAESTTSSSVVEAVAMNEPSSQGAKPRKKEDKRNEAAPGITSEWKPFASFVVEFQVRQVAGRTEEQRIKAHFVEGDKENEWSVLEGAQVGQWMVEQSVTREPSEPDKEVPVETKPAEVSSTIVEINQKMKLFQPPYAQLPLGTVQAGQVFPDCVKGGRPFALEVLFDLGETAKDLAKKRANYQVHFDARNWATGESTHLGDTPLGTITEGESTYSASLPTAILPPGVYRLRTRIELQNENVDPGLLEVPLFQVI